jgi:hypothetical protein
MQFSLSRMAPTNLSCEKEFDSEIHQVRNIAATATAITAVDNQPIAQSGRGKVNTPITGFCSAMIMITTINGTATTPFSTAAQNSALIGSIPTKLRP